MDLTALRALFPELERAVYLNTASMALGALPVRRAYERALAEWTAGQFAWPEAERAADEARVLFARIVGADPDEVALVPSVSTAAGIVAAQLPPARPGANILVGDIEYCSNSYPWQLLAERGYDVRLVPAVDGMLPPEAYAARADGGTRLVAVSAVQSATGYRADLPALSAVARRSDAWLFVDAAQAAGAVELDVRRDGVDFLAAPGYKYLLGTRGMGYLFVRRGLLAAVRPVLTGQRAARRPLEAFYGPTMELSETASKLDTSQAWFPALGDREALGVLHRFGVDGVLERNRRLTDHLYAVLTERRLVAHPFPVANRSPIVSVPVAEPEATTARLAAASVVVSVRAGRVRLSPHFYNTEADIDRAVGLLGSG